MSIRPLRLAVLLMPVLLLAAAVPARAAEILGGAEGGLYRATVIVTGREETRRAGLRQAFLAVLAKASGDPRLLADPAAAALAEAEAPAAAAAFSYRDRMAGIPVHDEQGSRDRPYDLTGEFDPARVGAALAALGRKPWPEPRPAVLAVVLVQTGGSEFVLTAGSPHGRDMLDALAAAAEGMALPTIVPDAGLLKRLGSLSLATLFTPGPEFTDATTRLGAAATLIGTLLWSDTDRGWVAEWHLEAGEEPGAAPPARWRVRGVSFDAAFRSGVGGAAQVLSGNGAPE